MENRKHSSILEESRKNPFTPTFGQIPCQIAGRMEIMSAIDYAFENADNGPSLTSIFVGPRGTGKTALLAYYAREMEAQGWISANVTCLPGMLEDIFQQTKRNASHILNTHSSISSVSAALKAGSVIGGELKIEKLKTDERNWRSRMTDIIEELGEKGIGLLITIDEISPKQTEMTSFIADYQMWVREGRKVALLTAGLPKNVSSLISGSSISFLRRASRFEFGMIPDYEVEEGFRGIAKKGGKKIEMDALSEAVTAINGFPFMLQLVGYRAFMFSGDADEISTDDIRRGIDTAIRDLKNSVLRPTLDEVADTGIEFLKAMALDNSGSLATDIAARMGKSSNYIATYKARLIAQGVIEERGRKLVFALPQLKEYLLEYER